MRILHEKIFYSKNIFCDEKSHCKIFTSPYISRDFNKNFLTIHKNSQDLMTYVRGGPQLFIYNI